jgi:RPA family protein
VIAAQALALEVGEEGSGNVYVKGIVSSISTTTLSSFGNIDYYISTDGTTENQFYVYRGLYLGGNQFTSLSQLKVGDEVVIYGKVVNFKGNTPELTQGNYLYSLNGQTSGGGIDYENCEEKTVEQFIATGNDGNYYKLTGTVSRFNATYCSFDLTDASGTIYVYSVANKDDWSDKIKNGGTVTLAGKYEYYSQKSQHEVVNAQILSFTEGGDEPGGETAEPKTVTIAEFNAAEESSTQPYRLTGTIGGSINTTYGNFDLTDETGTVYVYGLTATNLGYGASNDKSYASLGLKAGDKVTLIGFRGSFNDKIEVMYAYYVSHEAGEGGDEPGGGDEPALEDDFTSNVTWTLGTNASTQEATVNGTAGVSVLKLGTSKAAGEATLSVPKGTKKVTFYAVSWNNKPTKLVAKVGDTEIYSVDPAANAGANNNSPYTLTVASSDRYTMDLGSALEADTEVTVTTSGTNTRVIIFAIKAE